MDGLFAGARVLAFESRRRDEIARLIQDQGGQAVLAPALRQVGAEDPASWAAFAGALADTRVDWLLLLTGTGTRDLWERLQSQFGREAALLSLRRVRIAARGPKPAAAVRALGLEPAAVAPEPCTWHELIAALRTAGRDGTLQSSTIAVQEYGAPSPELMQALSEVGARVLPIELYRWELPEDLRPLRDAVRALAVGTIQVTLFTNAVQAEHLFRVADGMGQAEVVRTGLRRSLLASIGPTTTAALERFGLQPDLEPSHPRLGFLVREAAQAYARRV